MGEGETKSRHLCVLCRHGTPLIEQVGNPLQVGGVHVEFISLQLILELAIKMQFQARYSICSTLKPSDSMNLKGHDSIEGCTAKLGVSQENI